MKRLITILISTCISCLSIYAQWNNNGDNTTTGNLKIAGYLGIGSSSPRAFLDVNDLTVDSLKTVMARLPEGNDTGGGSYLGARSHWSQKRDEASLYDVKMFSIEHKFGGELNNSINFYRGTEHTGGSVGINAHDGREVARFSNIGLKVLRKITANDLDISENITGKKLDINGTIRAKEVKIEATGWSDFVFAKEYKLPSLESVEQHINKKQHLPDMPSEKQVMEEGVNIVEMQAKLLQKIEELTLYVIQLDKENKDLKKKVEALSDQK